MRRLLFLLLPAVLLLAGCSSEAAPTMPNVVGQAGDDARDALEAKGLKVEFDGGGQLVILKANWTVDSTSPAAGARIHAGDTVTVFVHKTGTPSAAPRESAGPTQTATPPVKKVLASYTGSGKTVLKVHYESPVIVAFSCEKCSSTLSAATVRSDLALQSILIDAPGPYRGRVLADAGAGLKTLSELDIAADARWKLQIQDPSAAIDARLTGAGQSVSGTGDDVFSVGEKVERLDIRSTSGDGNFFVDSYRSTAFDGSFDGYAAADLIVNDLDGYRGEASISGPAIVAVQSGGKWVIKAK